MPLRSESNEAGMFPSFASSTYARVLATGALVLLFGAVAAFVAWRRPSRGDVAPLPDPRRSYTGPFVNVRPDVAYVGSSVCAECHVAETQSYRAHPMGRSLAPIRDFLQEVPSGSENAGFALSSSQFRVEQKGDRLWHRQTRLDAAGQPIYTLQSEVQYVIGSGTRGYSFLSDRDGYLLQTAISWFSQKHVWGLSPGFSPSQFPGRPIAAECLFCHAHRVRPRSDTDNGYEQPIFAEHAIGCERCHGPGHRHVEERSKVVPVEGGIDYSIFNPSKEKHKHQIEPVLRDAVCEQCHLSGEVRVLRRGRDLYDFRPGLPLQLFWSVLVRDHRSQGKQKAVNHVEQMHLSRCYQESSGAQKLECVSCHNPHDHVAAPRRVSYYRARCLRCHETHACALPREQRLVQSKEDSCIECHMPRYTASDIPHTAATDHRIVRRRDLQFQEKQASPRGEREGNELDALQSFYDAGKADDRELARDRAVALTRLIALGKGEPRLLARQVLDLLPESPTAYPDDVPAWEARGAALAVLGRNGEALTAFEKVLERTPGREYALRAAGRLAQEIKDLDKAVAYWRRAVDSNPQSADYHGNLALVLAERGNWVEAGEQCRLGLRLDPGNLDWRKLWVRCLRKQGERQAALTEMEQLRRLEE